MMPLAAEHFVRAPGWTWYILFYFFLAGLSGGSYVIATLLRLYGNRSDEPTARLGYYIAFPMSLVCGILLTMDLRQPLRFWHMLVNTTPGQEAPIFKSWSPMSVGSWALAVFGVFTAVSFLEVLIRDRVIRTAISDRAVRLLDGAPGKVWTVVGAVPRVRAGRLGIAARVARPLPARCAGQRRCARPLRTSIPAPRARADRGLRADTDSRRHAGPGLRLPLDSALAGRVRGPRARARRSGQRGAQRQPRRGGHRPIGARCRGSA